MIHTDLQCDGERGIGIWIADADMAKGVGDVVVREDMICGDERCE